MLHGRYTVDCRKVMLTCMHAYTACIHMHEYFMLYRIHAYMYLCMNALRIMHYACMHVCGIKYTMVQGTMSYAATLLNTMCTTLIRQYLPLCFLA